MIGAHYAEKLGVPGLEFPFESAVECPDSEAPP